MSFPLKTVLRALQGARQLKNGAVTCGNQVFLNVSGFGTPRCRARRYRCFRFLSFRCAPLQGVGNDCLISPAFLVEQLHRVRRTLRRNLADFHASFDWHAEIPRITDGGLTGHRDCRLMHFCNHFVCYLYSAKLGQSGDVYHHFPQSW